MSKSDLDQNVGTCGGGLPEGLREKLHCREAICRRMEELSSVVAIDFPAQIEAIAADFAAAPEVPPEFAELLDKRFLTARQAAENAASAVAEKLRQGEKLRAELDALLAAGVLATLPELRDLETRWQALPHPAGEDERFAADLAPLKERLLAEAAEAEAKSAAALQLAARLKECIAAGDVPALRDAKEEIEKQFAALGTLPHAAAAAYNEAHKDASILIAQHFETLDLARWESYTLKLDICGKLEALAALPDSELPDAARQLNELRARWKTLGSVPKEKSEEINPRFLELTRSLQHRIDEFFSRRRQEQKEAAAAKKELCTRAAELANSTDWGATGTLFKELQAQWKQLPRAGSVDRELFQEFRRSADTFFNARNAAFAERNAAFQAAADAKNALIAEAEALGNGGSVQQAKELRERFRQIGSAGRAEMKLRERFDRAMENFFNGRREEFAKRKEHCAGLAAELETLCADPLAGRERASAIREELRSAGCRETAEAERTAIRHFSRALDTALAAEQEKKRSDQRELLRELGTACSAFLAGDVAPFTADDRFNAFPKLARFAALLAAAPGDEQAAAKLRRAVESARAEHERINSELEKLAGVGNAPAAEPLSLAAELEAAILGNSGAAFHAGSSRGGTSARQLIEAYPGAGVLPAEELEQSFRRFDEARKILKDQQKL